MRLLSLIIGSRRATRIRLHELIEESEFLLRVNLGQEPPV